MSSILGKVWKHATRPRGNVWMRNFSSEGRFHVKSNKPHIVRQLTCYNEMNLPMKKWSHCELFAEKNRFLDEVIPGGLLRPDDIATGPKFMQSFIGIKALKQGISFVALNLKNGRNVGHLLKPDNVLFSEEGDILLRHTHLPGEEELEGTEHNHVAFQAFHDLYFGQPGVPGLLEISAGQPLTDKDLSPDLIHLRDKMANSALVDKRIITNHQAQMFPEERDQLILLVNQFTRNEAASAPDDDPRRSMAGSIFIALGKLVPHGVNGIHPMFDYWINHGKQLGSLINAMDGAAVTSTPTLPPNDYLNGLTLVARMRASLLHTWGPWRAGLVGEYTMEEVQKLTHYKIPMFGPTCHSHFLLIKLDEKIEVNKSSKPDYLKWNDIPTPPQPCIIKPPSPRIIVPTWYQTSGGFK